MAEQHYDIVIIGCGAAGLSAAVAYLDTARARGAAARIAVLERADREGRGGATRWTGSWFRITAERRLDPNFVAQMEQASGGLADLDYCRVLEREVSGSIAFLEDHGVEVVYFPQPFPNRNTGGGLGMPAGAGAAIVDGLAAVIEDSEAAEIHYRTEAVDLHLDAAGRVAGVRVRGPDGLLRTLHARDVVIACGGFEGSSEMLTRYLGERACDLPVVAPTLVNNRGDGIVMAQRIGADTAGQFDMFHGEPADRRSDKPDAVVYAFPYGIVVNGRGERFFDEGQDSFDHTFEAFAWEIWRHQNQEAYFIGDQTTLAIDNIDQIILTDLPPVSDDSIAGLAARLGLDPAALEATVASYNGAVGDAPFDPYRRDGKATRGLSPPKSNWAFPLESPPYIAYPLTCAITFTFGGLRTDSRARVLTPGGTAIPGLYAAGEVTGLYYHAYPVGTSVLRAITFGRLAGSAAAAQES
jgi:tricarballylate dehydrogenase